MALASAILFGASTPFSKLLLREADPQLLAGLLYLGAGVGLAFVHLGRAAVGLPAPEAPLRRSDIPWLSAVVLFGGMIGPLLLMLGLVRTNAASAALLLNLEGLATMSIAWLVFRENVDRRLLLGARAILSGAVVLSWEGHGVLLDSGALLVAGACLAWGIDNNLTRKLSSADPVLIAMTKCLVGGRDGERRACYSAGCGLAVSRGVWGSSNRRIPRRRRQPRTFRLGSASFGNR
jgi:drug/metabolite transporter (DMT)-like permease